MIDEYVSSCRDQGREESKTEEIKLTQIYSSQGAGTEEACLIDILASRTNDEIKAITAFYKKRKQVPSMNRIPDIRSLASSPMAPLVCV